MADATYQSPGMFQSTGSTEISGGRFRLFFCFVFDIYGERAKQAGVGRAIGEFH